MLELPASANHAELRVRRSGQSNLLVEFGAPVLDLVLRFQVQALLEELQARKIAGLLDLTPGIRSLQIHFDPALASQTQVLDWLLARGRIACQASIACGCRAASCTCRCPGMIRRRSSPPSDISSRCAPMRPGALTTSSSSGASTGSKRREQVRDIVFGASYLVMGLGDVYLGAPVATPLDPRHRLVTTKYNPARTWTPENAVGIGGAYLCVYGMEGPGGYQFVGRTVQMWNRYRQTADFRDGKQWLLRFFDQIRFYPVSSDELLKLRAGFPYGRHPLRIEESHLDLGDYLKFLESQRESIDAFRQRQRSAFDAERERWRAAGLAETPIVETAARAEAPALPEDCVAITSPVSGSVWQIKVAAGQAVEKGDTLVIMEAMKMEIAVLADTAGTVHSIHGIAGAAAHAGDTLLVFKPVLS